MLGDRCQNVIFPALSTYPMGKVASIPAEFPPFPGLWFFQIISSLIRSFLVHVPLVRPLSRIVQKIRLAEPYFRLISGSAEFLRNLRNSAENAPKHHKFGQQDRQIETIKFKI